MFNKDIGANKKPGIISPSNYGVFPMVHRLPRLNTMERVEELKSLDLSRCAWACVVLEVRVG